MPITTFRDEKTDRIEARASIDARERDYFNAEVWRGAIEKVASDLAAQFIEKHGAEILAKISQEAVASLAIAAAGAKINETLNKKMPDKILEIERQTTQVYERGFFGGLKRVR